MDIIKTKRLILRPLKLSDVESFYNYAKKPNIGPKAGWQPHTSIEESLKILQLMIKENEVWAITLKDCDQLIGTIGLHERNIHYALENKRELGYVLDDTYWNQGLMTEAAQGIIFYGFKTLKLDKIMCGHYIDNAQSKRVIEKLGFKYVFEGEHTNASKEKVKIKMYEITKDNYLKRSMKNDNIR